MTVKLIPIKVGCIEATFVDTGKKPSIEDIRKQLMENALNYEPFDDEVAFERYLIRKWIKESVE